MRFDSITIFEFIKGMYNRFDLFKVSSGCNCCEVSGNLVTDGTTWMENGKVYGRFDCIFIFCKKQLYDG